MAKLKDHARTMAVERDHALADLAGMYVVNNRVLCFVTETFHIFPLLLVFSQRESPESTMLKRRAPLAFLVVAQVI